VDDGLDKTVCTDMASCFARLFATCQVEYLPCTVAADCWPLLKEFIVGLLGSDVSSALEPPSQHFQATFNAPQTPSDVALQYLEHFNNFRKAVSQLPR